MLVRLLEGLYLVKFRTVRVAAIVHTTVERMLNMTLIMGLTIPKINVMRFARKAMTKYDNPSRKRREAKPDQSFEVASFQSLYAVKHNTAKSTNIVIEVNAAWRARP